MSPPFRVGRHIVFPRASVHPNEPEVLCGVSYENIGEMWGVLRVMWGAQLYFIVLWAVIYSVKGESPHYFLWHGHLSPHNVSLVGTSVRHKSCPLYNLKTIKDFSMKLGTLVNHDETMCHAQEP